MSERFAGWQLVVWHDETIVLWHTASDPAEIQGRADELQAALRSTGWTAAPASDARPREYFRRVCPECRQQTAVVTFRRHSYIVLYCDTCEHGWTDRERVPRPPDIRPPQLPHRDRRRAA